MQQQEINQFANLLEKSTACLVKWQGKIIVVKYGGNAMINEELKKSVMADLLLLHRLGVKVVLVHGGGPEISQGVKLLGKEPQFINGCVLPIAIRLTWFCKCWQAKLIKALSPY